MAGHGPSPKQKDERVNRATPQRGEWTTLPSDPYKGPRPDLRGLPIRGALSASSKRAWASWWSSPMAHMWTEAEWPKLLRLLAVGELVNRMTKDGITRGLSSLLTEQRHLEDGLGISEKGRRDLRWLLPDGDHTGSSVVSEADELAKRREARVRRRRAVDPGGAAQT